MGLYNQRSLDLSVNKVFEKCGLVFNSFWKSGYKIIPDKIITDFLVLPANMSYYNLYRPPKLSTCVSKLLVI